MQEPEEEVEDEYQPKRDRIHPIWRGVGCLSLIALTIGVYWAADTLLAQNRLNAFIPFPIPDMSFSIGPIRLPWGTFQQSISWISVALAAVIDVIVYGFVFVAYSLANPIKLGPKDAPPVYPRKGRQKSLIR